MRANLHLEEPDFIRLPALFLPVVTRTSALVPGMVNMLPLGTKLVIPKQWGPRVSIGDAELIITGMYGITPSMVATSDLNALQNEIYWAGQGETLAEISNMFRVPVADVRPTASGGVSAGVVTAAWAKIQIVDTRVDLFEAYAAVKLKNLGLEPYFIDDWNTYHENEGEIHCGTNALRTPPELTSSRRWWTSFPQLARVMPYVP